MPIRTTVIAVLGSVILLSFSGQAVAQMTPLGSLNCTSDNYPECGGWGAVPTSAYFTRRFLPGIGPQGQNVVEFSHTPVDHHAQYYNGWWGPQFPNPAQGAVRYLRIRMRPVGAIRLEGVEDVWTDKFIIVADGDNPMGRVICHLRDNGRTTDNVGIGCSRNIDGYPSATNGGVPLPSDTWSSLQFEFKSSSTTSSGNGSLKIWRDNDNYGAPSVQSGAFQLNTTNWGRVSVGFYANATLRSGSRFVYQIADIQWDDEFDSHWAGASSGGGGTGGGGSQQTAPAAPANLRLIAGGVGIMPLSLVLGLAVRRRSLRRTNR
jgi:hypothetical protein